MDTQSKKAIYTMVERPDGDTGNKRTFWTRIGAAFLNRDGSFTIKLDALPVNGTLQMREWPVRQEEWRNRDREPTSTPPSGPQVSPAPRSHADIFAGGA